MHWRAAQALRLAQQERRAWLQAHGYVGPGGHVDWARFRREHPECAP
jgi:hypothetical protein